MFLNTHRNCIILKRKKSPSNKSFENESNRKQKSFENRFCFVLINLNVEVSNKNKKLSNFGRVYKMLTASKSLRRRNS